MRRPATGLAVTLLLLAPLPAFAGVLPVPLDHTVKLNISGAAASVVVGNPAVADVHVVDSHTVFVAGRGFREDRREAAADAALGAASHGP